MIGVCVGASSTDVCILGGFQCLFGVFVVKVVSHMHRHPRIGGPFIV